MPSGPKLSGDSDLMMQYTYLPEFASSADAASARAGLEAGGILTRSSRPRGPGAAGAGRSRAPRSPGARSRATGAAARLDFAAVLTFFCVVVLAISQRQPRLASQRLTTDGLAPTAGAFSPGPIPLDLPASARFPPPMRRADTVW